MCICLALTAYFVAVKRGYGAEQFPGWTALAFAFFGAIPGLMTAIIIVGGGNIGLSLALELENGADDVRAKIKRLRTLEKELSRISKSCDGEGVSEDCYVLASLADHNLCDREH